MQSENFLTTTRLAKSKIPGARVVSETLSDVINPHFAKSIIRSCTGREIAVFADLLDVRPETTVTAALLWFSELQKLKGRNASKLWIISRQTEQLNRLVSLLTPDTQNSIRVFDRLLNESADPSRSINRLRFSDPGRFAEMFSPLRKLVPEDSFEEIQYNGTSAAFRGLPFARSTEGDIWFGIENEKTLLQPQTFERFCQFFDDLRTYRRHDSPNRSHSYYRLLPEAWLESTLRRNITKLDPNLILSPLHYQFRAAGDQIDLFALRRDGRLVIIELKALPNREHLFQSLGYFAEIESQRKAGNLRGLFGDREISDRTPLVYLAAPHSAFHPTIRDLAAMIVEDVEIFRFDLNESWRREMRVLERTKL